MLVSEQYKAVLRLQLNRPEKRNALHPDLLAPLQQTLAATAQDDQIAAVILTGAGSSFCAGLDLTHLLAQSTAGKMAYLEGVFALFQQLYTLPQPVIAAINGPALAGGFDLAAMCDIRLCAPAATFAQTEVLLGLTQMSYPLYKIIGLSRAKELALTGDAISADEAYRIGLVNHIYAAEELPEQAMALAEKLAARPRQALFATKRLTRELLDVDTPTAFRQMKETIFACLASAEHQQQAESFVARLKQRQPKH